MNQKKVRNKMQDIYKPWKLVIKSDKRFNSITGEPIINEDAWIYCDGGDLGPLVALVAGSENKAARGHRIAAAPEMLEALELVTGLYESVASSKYHYEIFNKCSDIIRKARGE